MIGGGFFAGIGGQWSVSHSGCEYPAGISSEYYLHGEANAGWKLYGGYSVDIGMDSQSFGRSPRYGGGVGYGAMIAAGISLKTTIVLFDLW